MDSESANLTTTAKLPVLKPENGNSFKPKTQTSKAEGSSSTTSLGPTTTEEKIQKRNDVKARSTLLMALPNEHQLKFNQYLDAKSLLDAIEKRFSGNDATKTTKKNLLKQQYENFSASSTESLDQTFDRLQKLRNKHDLGTLSMDDLYNNLKVYETEVKGAANSSSDTKNMAFNLEQINEDDLEEMDLKWQMARLTIRARRFLRKTGRNFTIKGNETAGFDKESTRRSVAVETASDKALVSCDGLCGYDWSDRAAEGPNYALMAYSTSSLDSEVSTNSNCSKTCLKTIETLKSQLEQLRKDLDRSELMAASYKGDIIIKDSEINHLKKKLESVTKEKDSIQLNVNKLENASKNLDKLLECQITDKCKKGLGFESYNAVPPPHTGRFLPLKPDLPFSNIEKNFDKSSESVNSRKSVTSVKELPKEDRKNSDAPIIEDWVLDDDSEDEVLTQPKEKKIIVKPSVAKVEVVKPKQQDKKTRKIANCNYHQRMVQPAWNYKYRVNYQSFAKRTHPSAQKTMVPRAVLMKFGLKPLNTARQVNTAHTKPTMNVARPMMVNVVKRKVNVARSTTVTYTNNTNRVSAASSKVTTWIFFLDSKDETSGILMNFITEIENLVDHKVKVIRCDNRSEFKNRVINQFCEKKGIKREYSVSRTPQQNGVAKRRNMTLIEAAKTMLGDSKLPTTFWAEAVNISCYV
ncbi:ribonuclease H-like domain-containing protein [Tanacetum coccineum]